MTFIWPHMLWLLAAVAGLAAGYLLLARRRRWLLAQYPGMPLLTQALGRPGGWRRNLPAALLMAGIAVMVLAVARPAAVVTLASSRGTIVLAMDVSGSMRARDIVPSRLQAAQAAAKTFINGQPADVQVGIVAFAGAAYLVQAPTIDRAALGAAIDRFELRPATAVGAGILAALAAIFPDEDFVGGGYGELFDPWGRITGRSGYAPRSLDQQGPDLVGHEPVEPGSYRNALVVLLTDGATTTGPDPIGAGQMAADYGVRVFTVGFGSVEGGTIELGETVVQAKPDLETLQHIATMTGAEFFEADSAEGLSAVYDRLSNQLVAEKKLTEIAFLFCAVAAALAVGGAGLSVAWTGRIG